MKIVHVSWSPVAGSPARIVKSLNTYTECTARHITLEVNAYGQRTYETDLDWAKDREESIACLYEADLLHVHQWIHFDDFLDKDLAEVCKKKLCLRQFHSAPAFLSWGDPALEKRIINDPIPQLVIAQAQYAFYPHARAVPNIVEDNQELCTAGKQDLHSPPCIAFSPSVSVGAWEDRWATKAAPEVISILLALEKKGLCTLDVITDTSYHACIQRKAQADIIIDDLVTGSHHLSGLEGLALGKAVFGWLDNQVQSLLYRITKSPYLPWVNVHLEDFPVIIEAILSDKNILDNIKRTSRDWFLRWYHPKDMVQHYVRAYADLLHDPSNFQTLRPEPEEATFLFTQLPDLLWQIRHQRYAREHTLEA